MKRPPGGLLAATLTAALVAALLGSAPARAAGADTPTPDQQWTRIQQIVGGIKGRWTTQAYTNAVSNTMPDTALLGNGDIGVTSGGGEGYKTFYVSKGNFWTGNPNPSLVSLGAVTITPVSGTGQANLALGATATASSSDGSFPPARAVSGQWGPGYEGWVSAVGKVQSLTLDLRAAKTFDRYVVRHDGAARPAETAHNTRDFTLSVSSDGSAWRTVDTVAGNAANVTDRSFAQVTARYVRLNITEPTQGSNPDTIANPRARIGQIELYSGNGPTQPSGPFAEEQNILKGDIDTSMTIGGTPVSMRTWTAADSNLLVTRIQSLGSASVRLQAQTSTGAPDPRPGFTSTSGVDGGTVWATRQTASGSRWVSRASLATRVLGGTPVGSPTSGGAAGRIVFDLPAGQTATIVTAVAGGGQNPADPGPAARSLAAAQTSASLDSLYAAHVDWWKRYWLKSYVDLGDDVLQRYYYGSLYLLGSASRAGKTAPGLYGIWATTDHPQFNGDMHLNYNWMANFYGVYSSNRPELALPYFDLVAAYLPEARRRARQDLARVKPDYVSARFPSGGLPGGVLFPVGIAPFGATADDNYHQQVANSLFTATQYISFYEYTRDRAFLSGTAYPLMKEVATFFRYWLEWDAGSQRYNLWSGPHEGTWARNSSPDLGLLRRLLSATISASVELGADAADRATWQGMLDRLAPQPRTTVDGRSVYALGDPGTISDGRAIRPGDNTVNLEFVHPGEVLGLGSPAADRQAAVATLDVMNSWGQDNSFPKVFTQAARVGYPAQSLIDRLKGQISTRLAGNLRIIDPHHGLEKAGAVEAVNDLLLQTDGGVMRVFPVWPAGRDASFVKLRAKDGLVVSSARTGGQVGYVDVTSEAGRTVRLANPWPGRPVVVTRVGGGTVTPTVSGDVVSFPTQQGATYTITPG
ncbi:glycosyl hydrolase family 95 catalytic domain-containing protein [Nonomuraea jiangxiensis]|uniref:F5/8 type C domain-containing protein n=1 Tax=Nonomuraea jiangxiensis TaxID=633440 RepID=A0A1G8QBY0_9ACTN|nr:discoidin domain-containing protein [Nonomuraea jiangxiensis]SDJ02076.1 F5/8 type C domain-containing protein [Nonomuraea jiangxiensis]